MSWRIASKMFWICSSCPSRRSSSSTSLKASSLCVAIISRSRTNTRMMAMLTSMARSLLRTLDSIATPCSVNAKGKYLEYRPGSKITFCDLRDRFSSFVSSNIKSLGNRFLFLLTACFSTLVSTPYKPAKSLSSMTFCPRTSRIAFSIRSTGIGNCFRSHAQLHVSPMSPEVVAICDRSNLKSQFVISSFHARCDLRKRQSPMSQHGEMGLCIRFYVGPSCLTPPRSQKGLRANNLEGMIRKGVEKVKAIGGIERQEYSRQ